MTVSILVMRCKNEIQHQTPAPKITKAYLLGALHDATKTKYTFRICQKSFEYIQLLATGINYHGFKSWIYKEGKNRNIFVVEFSRKLLESFSITSINDKTDYIRGYFDAEGGIPRSFSSRYYIYFAQKNFEDVSELRNYLIELEFNCGKVHIPSKNVDPDYFRFYILRNSMEKFGKEIGSLHPVKSKYIRMKI